MTAAVGRRRIDPVDPELECPLERRDRVAIVLVRPPVLPVPAAGSPGPEAQRADLKPGAAELVQLPILTSSSCGGVKSS